jgi:5-methyltetrahydrofolate--homocysteine methyltransferase
MGTELIRAGLPVGQPSERFLRDNPAAVAEVHRAYAAAGAVVLTTNTFGSNRLRLAQAGIDLPVAECAARAVELARSSASSGGWIAGSIGPACAPLAPEVLSAYEAAYEEQAAALAAAGADLLLVETMVSLREARMALQACRTACALPVVVTLALSRGRRGFVTPEGDAAGDALVELADAGAAAVGANCALDSATMAALAGPMRSHISAPLLLRPCAGQPRQTLEGLEYPENPAIFAQNARRMADIGIDMIGGCCGTTPTHIAAARRALDERGAV